MQAFLNDPAIKAKYLGRVDAHREADQLVKGKYWEDGKGCAVGCTIHSSNHIAYETLLGIPVALARLEDAIFEGLPNERAMTWPSEFLQSIEVGKDLSLVTPKFLYWLLTTPAINPGIEHELVKDAIGQCAAVVKIWADGGVLDKSARSAAESAARSAAESAAWSAAWSAWSAARSAYVLMADKLIELLKAV